MKRQKFGWKKKWSFASAVLGVCFLSIGCASEEKMTAASNDSMQQINIEKTSESEKQETNSSQESDLSSAQTQDNVESNGAGVLYEQRKDQVAADLDGDGEKDTIYYDTNQDTGEVVLKINGIDFSGIMNDKYCMCNPEHDYFYIADLDKTDTKLELAFMDFGPSSDEVTQFLRFDGKNLTQVGYVPGYTKEYGTVSESWYEEPLTLTVNGDGTVDTNYERMAVIQTWFAPATYEVNAAGELELREQSVYYPFTYPEVTEDGTTYEYNLKLKMDLPIYQEMGEKDAKPTILKPQRVKLTATDNKNWAYVEAEDGTKGWFHFGEFDEIDAVNKKADEVFDGLNICD